MTSPVYLKHEDLKLKKVKYGFLTNKGGFSKKEYSSLNFGFNVNDNEDNVSKNWQHTLEFLNSKTHHLMNLDHGDNIIFIDENQDTMRFEMKALDIDFVKHDACFTNQKNITIFTTSADCLNIIFVNEEKSIIGACHSGWQGTFKGINDKCAKYMLELDKNHENWHIIFGPYAFEDGYEVDELFYKNFIKKNPENEKFFKKNNNKYFYNNGGVAIEEYRKNGLKNIHNMNIDTLTSPDFYSHRKATLNNTKTGRFCSFVEII